MKEDILFQAESENFLRTESENFLRRRLVVGRGTITRLPPR
jgi:hypothetical protein